MRHQVRGKLTWGTRYGGSCARHQYRGSWREAPGTGEGGSWRQKIRVKVDAAAIHCVWLYPFNEIPYGFVGLLLCGIILKQYTGVMSSFKSPLYRVLGRGSRSFHSFFLFSTTHYEPRKWVEWNGRQLCQIWPSQKQAPNRALHATNALATWWKTAAATWCAPHRERAFSTRGRNTMYKEPGKGLVKLSSRRLLQFCR